MKQLINIEVMTDLYNQVSLLHDVTKMLKESDTLKSSEAKAFNAGQEFAYKNVLQLMQDKVEKEL